MLFSPFGYNMCKFASKNVTLNRYWLGFYQNLSIPDEE